MSKIRINDNEVVEGSFSFHVFLDKNSNVPLLIIEGVFETAARISEIRMLENQRYKLTGVTVQDEAYGSEEDTVAYTFLADKYEVKDGGA